MSRGERALGLLSEDVRADLPPQDHPEWVTPMKATLTDDRFSVPAGSSSGNWTGSGC